MAFGMIAAFMLKDALRTDRNLWRMELKGETLRPKEEPDKESSSPTNLEPEACPYCNEMRLTQSSSGKHLVCKKCGRIVVRGWPATWPMNLAKGVPYVRTPLKG